MGLRIVPVVLIVLLALLHVQLWTGRASVAKVAELHRRIDTEKAANERARQVNERLASEVEDLRQGLDMVEEKARGELGMVKPNEIYVQITK